MKKRFYLFVILLMVLLVPALSSCRYINSLITIYNEASTTTKIPNKSITVNYYVDDTIYKTETIENRKNFIFPEDPKKEGLNFGGWTYKDSYQTLDINDIIYKEEETLDLYAYFSNGYHFIDNIKRNGPYFKKRCLPSLGSPKVLVVPVNLGGSTTDEMISNINKTFNGTSLETGFESVSSYYKKSSNGKLNLQFDVVNSWFTPKYEPSYYESYDMNKDKYYDSGSALILNEFINEYDSTFDYSDYDYDNDGYIDAVWMIYNKEPNYSDNTFYWAYVTYTQNKSKKYDNKYPWSYGFASYEFIFEKNLAKKYNRELELYYLDDITYDAHTYIHETGHLLGLDDYYDSDTSVGGSGGIYSAGMMDANQGEMSTIDKILLGWIDPYVSYPTSGSDSFTIKPFSESNDVILISKNKPLSVYSEFFLVELYTNTGLNTHDTPINYPANPLVRQKYYGLDTSPIYGIRILHINAQMTKDYNGKTYNEYMDFVYNNSTTKSLFVDMIVNPTYRKYAFESHGGTKKNIVNSLALFTNTTTAIDLKNSSYTMTNQSNIFFDLKIESISTQEAEIKVLY